jgi:hypothetical protein
MGRKAAKMTELPRFRNGVAASGGNTSRNVLFRLGF